MGTTEKLRDTEEIELTVTGRTSGKPLPRPVWFVIGDDASVLLLPVSGSSTEWYKNVLKDPSVSVKAAGLSLKGTATPVKDKEEVDKVIQLFNKKYGAGNMKKYYTKLDVAVKAKVS